MMGRMLAMMLVVMTATANELGDINGDGLVTSLDGGMLADQLGNPPIGVPPRGDYDGDGLITVFDLSIWRDYYFEAIMLEVTSPIGEWNGFWGAYLGDEGLDCNIVGLGYVWITENIGPPFFNTWRFAPPEDVVCNSGVLTWIPPAGVSGMEVGTVYDVKVCEAEIDAEGFWDIQRCSPEVRAWDNVQ